MTELNYWKYCSPPIPWWKSSKHLAGSLESDILKDFSKTLDPRTLFSSFLAFVFPLLLRLIGLLAAFISLGCQWKHITHRTEAKSWDRTVPTSVGQQLVILRVLHHVKWRLKIGGENLDLKFWHPSRLQIFQEQREIQFTPQTLCGCERLRSAFLGSSACGVHSETERISWGRIHAGQCMVYLVAWYSYASTHCPPFSLQIQELQRQQRAQHFLWFSIAILWCSGKFVELWIEIKVACSCVCHSARSRWTRWLAKSSKPGKKNFT